MTLGIRWHPEAESEFDAFDLLHTGQQLSFEDAVEVLVTTAERTLCR